MWLQRFHGLYPVATERYTGRRQDLSQVEDHVSQARHEWKVDRRVLEIIEDPDSGWDYPKWWPRLSAQLEEPIPLPTHIYSQQGKRGAVKSLHEAIKNIEIVSVILRFICPDGFGIFSPPVESFLCLSALSNPVESYVRYLDVLKRFVEHYKVLTRVADIDMALWSAAHLSLDPAYAPLVQEMQTDEFLQEVRLANLVVGLGRFWRRTGLQRIALARVMLEHDFVVASVIGARMYESVLRDASERLRLARGVPQNIDKRLVDDLEGRPELDGLGLRKGELTALWKWRNGAVHAEPWFTREQAEMFVKRIGTLWQAWRNWKPSRS
jgi:hypothetical protein